jgi:hypothetical protein
VRKFKCSFRRDLSRTEYRAGLGRSCIAARTEAAVRGRANYERVALHATPAGEMERIRVILGVTVVKVEIGFDPPLDPSRVAQAAKLQLGPL